MEQSSYHQVTAYRSRNHFGYPLFFLLSLIICIIVASPALAVNQVGVKLGNQRFTKSVRSLAELRWNNLTRQGWDMSCGAAALSTLLTYHHSQKFSEMAITLTILKNSDPAQVRDRGGFSLYDLKRFVQAIGLEGVGYGEMSADDLRQFTLPAILPVRISDYDHFVVFRKIVGSHVMLGDPAFGNISLSVAKLNKMWKSKIAFYVLNKKEKELLSQKDSARQQSPLSPTLMESAIPALQGGARILNRMPVVPITRRATPVMPNSK